MKNLLSVLIVLGLTITGTMAMTFDDAYKQSSSKPMALLLYADWADGAEQAVQAFSLAEQRYSNKYNFVKLNIANKETKEYNKMSSILPNLPYVMLYREGIKFSRMIKTDCVKDSSCFSGKLDTFSN